VTRVTLDANVLAPGLTSSGSASSRLIDYWRSGSIELVISEHILSELRRTLADRYYASRLTPDATTAILAVLSRNATLTDLTVEVKGVATHPEDDLVLSTALSGWATVLCTRDSNF
jgi:putative PIN family toxin of toxin-antitoxin system